MHLTARTRISEVVVIVVFHRRLSRRSYARQKRTPRPEHKYFLFSQGITAGTPRSEQSTHYRSACRSLHALENLWCLSTKILLSFSGRWRHHRVLLVCTFACGRRFLNRRASVTPQNEVYKATENITEEDSTLIRNMLYPAEAFL
jgi:hypothetical protein